jgi:hypothetical protein
MCWAVCFFTGNMWFHLNGYINIQNSRILNAENPHALHENPVHLSKIGVWCAVSQTNCGTSVL